MIVHTCKSGHAEAARMLSAAPLRKWVAAIACACALAVLISPSPHHPFNSATPGVAFAADVAGTAATAADGASGSASVDGVDLPDFTVVVRDGGACIESYQGELPASGEVVVPDEIDGVPVVAIGEHVFAERPDCADITSVVLPGAVTSIGAAAFTGCTSLVSVKLPESLVTIGANAFNSCSSLEELAIPASVASIGTAAFAGCSSLGTFSVSEGNESYTYDGTALLSADGTTLVELVSDVAQYTTADGVTRVSDFAFARCASLESVRFGADVCEVGKGLFTNCPSLARIEVDPENEWFSTDGLVLYDAAGTIAIAASGKMEAYAVPSGVVEIGPSAFQACHALRSVALSDTVTRIGEASFSGSALENISIPSSVTEIGSLAFVNCKGLSAVRIPDSVMSIGESAFNGCSSLEALELPESVVTVGDYAFSNCAPGFVLTVSSPEMYEGIARRYATPIDNGAMVLELVESGEAEGR